MEWCELYDVVSPVVFCSFEGGLFVDGVVTALKGGLVDVEDAVCEVVE